MRLWSKHPKSLILESFTPISSDGERICFEEKFFSIEEFSIILKKQNISNLIVLTNKEKQLLLEHGFNEAFDIHVLESNFPFFSNIKYSPNLIKSEDKLKQCLKKVRQLNVQGFSIGQQTVSEGMYRTERKVRYKNALDSNFFFANLNGYQEVFKLKEERQDRMIIALDYNSMYASCMDGDFLEPKGLKYREFNQDLSKIFLPKGFYRVLLSKPLTEHITKFHSFKYTCAQRACSFKLNHQDKVELLLFNDEIDYYQQHFEKIYILDGIVSEKTIKHPLFHYASKLYTKRLRASKNKNLTLASLLKAKIAMLHGTTNTTKSKKRIFESYNELKNFLEDEFFISSLSNFSNKDFLEFLNYSNYFSVKLSGGKIELKYRNFKDPGNLFSLSAKVLANARLKMTKTLEMLNNFKGLEVCYVNIDSVHISIPRIRERYFFEYMESFISEKMGDLKVQCIADKGYWLDVGRYWLVKDHSVEQFANTGFNPPGNTNPFIKQNKKMVRFKSNAFDFCKPYYSSIENSFSFKKKLLDEEIEGSQNYERFDFEHISTLKNMLSIEQKEILSSLRTKTKTFELINDLYSCTVKQY